MLIFNYLLKKIKNNEKSKLLKQNYYGCMNSGTIKTKKAYVKDHQVFQFISILYP